MRDIKGLVVFAILMESGNGIVDKSPAYIWEKFQLAMISPSPEQLLDQKNRRKLERWLKNWSCAPESYANTAKTPFLF